MSLLPLSLVGRVLLMGVLAGSVPSPAPSPAPVPGPYDTKADAVADLEKAGKEAGTAGRRVLAVVGGNWCKWCRALDRLLVSDPEISSALASRFVVVHVNVSKENRNEGAMARLGRPDKLGYPSLVVLSPGLEVLRLQETGSLETADKETPGHDREKVLAFLREWGGKTE
jgi:hypothetical protein